MGRLKQRTGMQSGVQSVLNLLSLKLILITTQWNVLLFPDCKQGNEEQKNLRQRWALKCAFLPTENHTQATVFMVWGWQEVLCISFIRGLGVPLKEVGKDHSAGLFPPPLPSGEHRVKTVKEPCPLCHSSQKNQRIPNLLGPRPVQDWAFVTWATSFSGYSTFRDNRTTQRSLCFCVQVGGGLCFSGEKWLLVWRRWLWCPWRRKWIHGFV